MNPNPDSFIRGIVLLTCLAALMVAAHMLVSSAGAEACRATLGH
jgi:hypothetical protein